MQDTNSEYHRFVNYYHTNKDKLFTYLMYRLGFDRTFAENLMMDVFLKAYKQLDQFNSQEDSFQIWLFTLTHDHLENHLNGRKKKTMSLKKWKKEHSTEVDEVEYQMSEHVENKQVQYLFVLLKEEDRELIALRYLQGLKLKEISKITGKKEETIDSKLSHALEQLSELYKRVYLKK